MRKRIDLKEVIELKIPGYFDRYPKWLGNSMISLMNWILHMREINGFIENHEGKDGLEFIDELFEYLKFSYFLSSLDYQKIPAEGKLIIVSNHPLGGLDGLALLKAIGQVRKDVKIVVNDLLLKIPNIKPYCLPYDVFSTRMQRESLTRIKKALLNDEAVIFFPAAEVSRLGPNGIRDGEWKRGAVQFALKYQAPVLPVYIHGRNTTFFYLFSLLAKGLSTFLLPREIFHKRFESITIKVGDPIPYTSFSKNITDLTYQTRMLRLHVYRIGKGGAGVFKTEKTIMHPVAKKVIKEELSRSEMLERTSDGKVLYLVEASTGYHTIREIGRLRELTFRRVGEGTGNKLDTDKFDQFYRHLVLWDEESLEIVGSYRIGFCGEILEKHGLNAIYTTSLFDFKEGMIERLPVSFEMGRSFIQYKYWRSNALDLLWRGIGRCLLNNPHIRYMFGPVSISDSYSDQAKRIIVSYFKKWYGSNEPLAISKKRFILSRQEEEEIATILNDDDYKADYRNLKTGLRNLGYRVPILYKQYADMTEYGGTTFEDFGIDEDFSNVIDGFVVVDVAKVSRLMKKRYLNGG